MLSKHFDNKKNWLFVGSERAGKRAAAIQSLLATAELNGLDPAAWLRDTLEKLPTCLNCNIDSLLPLAHPAQHALLDENRWGGWTLTLRSYGGEERCHCDTTKQ